MTDKASRRPAPTKRDEYVPWRTSAHRRLTRHRRQTSDNYVISSGRCLAAAKCVFVLSSH